MTADLIDGKAFAADLRARIAAQVAAMKADHGVTPGLAVVLVGDDPASAVYVRSKGRAVDEERRRMFLTPGAFNAAERVIVLCYTPPGAMAHRLADALYHDDAPERRSALRMAIDGMQRVL